MSSLADMPRNEKKINVASQLTPEEHEPLLRYAADRDWSKAKLIQKIIRWWLGEIGAMPKVKRP